MKYKCPFCSEVLIEDNLSLSCSNKHNFDKAKSGYVNLHVNNNSSKSHGDNKLMVQARSAFLNQGYYSYLKDALVELIKAINPQLVVDCGCGEGYYTRAIQEALNQSKVIGIDLSKEAINYAAKRDKQSSYVISSIYKVPLHNQTADVVLSMFAPVALDEFERLLKKGGSLIVVSVGKGHLMQLKEKIYSEVYDNEQEFIVDSRFKLINHHQLTSEVTMNTQEDIMHCFMMTPYFYHTKKEDQDKLVQLTSLTTTLAFDVQIYHKL